MFKPNTKNLKVLTPDGYKLFDGIQLVEKEQVQISFDNGKTIRCSKRHMMCVDLFNNKFIAAEYLVQGDRIFGEDRWYVVKSIVDIGKVELYDIVNVHDTMCYYTDGILSHNCEFLNIGDAAIDEELFKQMVEKTMEPKFSFDEGTYKIWNEPDPTRVYVAGVDIGEGIGQNATVIEILDITDPTQIVQVAEYWNNKISPKMFVNKLNEILNHWGRPLALIERNNCGAEVVDDLLERFEYPYVVNWGLEVSNKVRADTYKRAGVISHSNVKFAAVQNMRYWVNDVKQVIVNSKDLVLELADFVKQPNGVSWGAKQGKLDDRVMAFVWAINMLHPICCQGFFEIVETDTYAKPKVIIPSYNPYGRKYKMQTSHELEYGMNRDDVDETAVPMAQYNGGTHVYQSELQKDVFQMESSMMSREQEMMRYLQQGWSMQPTQPMEQKKTTQPTGYGWDLLKLH